MEKKTKQRIKSYTTALILIAACTGADQFTKYLAVRYLKDQAPFIIWDGVFQFRYLENRGAAFGIMQNRQWIFVIGAVIVFFLIGYWYGKLPDEKRFLPLKFCGILICAGALGNMIDRLLHQYVVDFFYFELIDFPIFNVADIYVVVACFFFLFLTFFYYREDDLAFLEHKKR